MRHLLFISSDEYIEFKSKTKAFVYVHKKELTNWILLTTYPDRHKCCLFSPYIVKSVEYVESYSDALKYIGSFLS